MSRLQRCLGTCRRRPSREDMRKAPWPGEARIVRAGRSAGWRHTSVSAPASFGRCGLGCGGGNRCGASLGARPPACPQPQRVCPETGQPAPRGGSSLLPPPTTLPPAYCCCSCCCSSGASPGVMILCDAMNLRVRCVSHRQPEEFTTSPSANTAPPSSSASNAPNKEGEGSAPRGMVPAQHAHVLCLRGRHARELPERVGPVGEFLELPRELLQVPRLGRRGQRGGRLAARVVLVRVGHGGKGGSGGEVRWGGEERRRETRRRDAVRVALSAHSRQTKLAGQRHAND